MSLDRGLDFTNMNEEKNPRVLGVLFMGVPRAWTERFGVPEEGFRVHPTIPVDAVPVLDHHAGRKNGRLTTNSYLSTSG